MTTCNICCEKLNKLSRCPVECMYCQFLACRECCQTYILSESIPKCMNTDCGKEWTRKFLRDSFTATFINGPMKEWRERNLYDREKALLPATQIYAEAKQRIRSIRQEITDIDRIISQMKLRKEELQIEKTYLERDPTTLGTQRGEAPVEERRQFIKPCSVTDCRGYLSTQWKCGLCSTWACPDCHEIIGISKDSPHTCDPNNVETARALKKETKPCPKCSAAIFKIDGCDQIWCTQCHTAFSWRTGNIETRIHNPHYYEWLRNTQGSVPRDPLDVLPDGGVHACLENIEVGRNMLRQFEIVLRNKPTEFRTTVTKKIENILQRIIHIQETEIRQDNYENRNRALRIQFLMNDIDEKNFKIKLQQADKKHSKERDIQNVYEMVIAASGDILRRFLKYLSDTTSNFTMIILDEFQPLINYANECLSQVQYVYGGDVMQFTPDIILASTQQILYNVCEKKGFIKNRYDFISLSDNKIIELYLEHAHSPELTTDIINTPNKFDKIWKICGHATKSR